MNQDTFRYDNRIVRAFAIATVIWGLVGFLAGLLIACQLFLPDLNFNLQYTTFGRLRPLHTNAVIFAFVGNMMFAGIYYSTQRLCKCRTGSDLLSSIHFWGWQLIIVAAVVTPPDVLSQFMLALPMCLLYEAGLFCARFIGVRPRDAEPEATDPKVG